MTIITTANIIKAIESFGKVEAKGKAALSDIIGMAAVLYGTDNAGRNDIAAFNRLLAVLTPANKKAVLAWGKAHLPFTYDEKLGEFGGLTKKASKKVEKYQALTAYIDTYCGEEGKGFWAWYQDKEANRKSPTQKGVLERVTDTVKKAVSAKDKISQVDILKAVFAGGISKEALQEVLASMIED